eukprot:3780892-Alexandrium_andersonii.AAC.1
MPEMCLSHVARCNSIESPSAHSLAIALSSGDGVGCCCTARSPKVSELTKTGVLRASLSMRRRVRRRKRS